jgi:histidinol-phosphate aminotransferase
MFNLKNIVRPSIWSLKPYSSARDEYSRTTGVFLDANENPFGLFNRYPDPHQKELKQKLAILKNVSADQIFIGNGSDEAIDLAFRIFCTPEKDKALTFTPTYGMYAVSAAINAIELLNIPLTREFQIEIELLDKCLIDSQLKVIFICSPNNPTGNSINKKAIEFILKKFKGIVIIDEAYIDFSPSESWVSLIRKYPNLIVCQTFSKAWGLAAARVGIAYANEKIIQLFNNVKPPYNVSHLNQQAALEALSAQAKFEENKQNILIEKGNLREALTQIKLVKKVYPSDANFFFVEVVDADKVYEYLIDHQVIVRNRNNVVNNCIRISIGTPEENQKLLTALKKIKL